MDFYTQQHPSLNKPKPKYGISDLKKCGPLKRRDTSNDAGIKLMQDRATKKVYVKELVKGGMFERMTSIKEGDQVIKINGKMWDEFTSLFDMNKVFQTELELTVHVFTDAARAKYG